MADEAIETPEQELIRLRLENGMLRDIHYFSRGVMRYNGIDSERCNENYAKLTTATHTFTDYTQQAEHG